MGSISELAEHLFRQESGRLVSTLTRLFGSARLGLAEDMAQEALLRALQTWPYYGVPANPAAWLTQTAKNLALDYLRREGSFQRKAPEIALWAHLTTGGKMPLVPVLPGEISDDVLRLMFICCHPALPAEGRVALALRTLCGFSEAEIATAFLVKESAIAKRLTRVRAQIRELEIPFEIPAGHELVPRLESVLQTIYLVFNEGYKASHGPQLVRKDLCLEAIRLATLVAEHDQVSSPEVFAMLALMLLNAARLDARTNQAGELLRLNEQDRGLWDQEMIARGFLCLQKSAAGPSVRPVHFEAAIAACHCRVMDYAQTDWQQILSLYDQMQALGFSPVSALNRVVAVSEVSGPEAALRELDDLARSPAHGALTSYYLFYSVRGDLKMKLGHAHEARKQFQQGLALTTSSVEQAFLRKQINRTFKTDNI